MSSRPKTTKSFLRNRASFTLIELLIVIAIIAVLATVVILVLNPAQLLAQSRDATRVSDLATVNQALNLYSTEVTSGDMGTSSVLYVSIPDPAATTAAGSNCADLGLPSLPSGWTYHCAGPTYYHDVNGEGWIPVNFTQTTGGSPLAKLPVDPTNTTSSGLYYTYTVQGDPWELTAVMESTKYKAQFTANPTLPDYPGVDAVGTDLSLSPLFESSGLVGYWKLDEGTGTIAIDSSGMGDNMTLKTSSTDSGPTWITNGCIELSCLSFDGTDDYAQSIKATDFSTNQSTLLVWLKPEMGATCSSLYTENAAIYQSSDAPGIGESYHSFGGTYPSPCDVFFSRFVIGGAWSGISSNYATTKITDGQWYFLAVTYSASSSVVTMYVNGNVVSTKPQSGTITYQSGDTFFGGGNSTAPYKGLIDDVRYYNRALSAAEIQAIYNSEK